MLLLLRADDNITLRVSPRDDGSCDDGSCDVGSCDVGSCDGGGNDGSRDGGSGDDDGIGQGEMMDAFPPGICEHRKQEYGMGMRLVVTRALDPEQIAKVFPCGLQ